MAARGVEGIMRSNGQLEQRAVGTTRTRTRTRTRMFFGRRMRKSLGRISATSSSSVSSPSFSERDRVLVVEQLKPAETLAATSGQRAENCIVQAPSSHLDAPPRPPPLAVASSTSLSITDPQIVSTILQAFALFAFGGFLSLSETALTTLWPWKIKELANEEGPSSPFYAVQQNVTRFLTTILIGSTVSSILATAMMTEAIVKVYGEKAIGLANDCDVGVCFVVLRDCAEIDRGTARVGSWEVSSDADSDDVDDFVPVGKDMHRHRGFWVSFVSDTNERGAIC